MKNFSRNFFMRVGLVVASVFFSAMAFAQANATTFLNTTKSQLTSISTVLINVVSVGIGIGGVIMLVPNVIKYSKGDPSSSDAMMKLGAGLVIAAILLQVIKVTFLSS